MEMTVEAVRRTVSAKVVALPFFNPARKTAVPVIERSSLALVDESLR
jgi:hypothetical protein